MFQNTSNSTTAFEIQNSGGDSVFNADTTNKRIGIGTNAPNQLVHLSSDVSSANASIQIDGSNATNNEGPNYCSTGVSDASVGTVAWSSPSNGCADDGSNTTAFMGAGTTSEYLKATNFGFSIPSGATVDGIVAEAEVGTGFGSGEAIDDAVRIVKGGTIGSTDRSNPTAWTTTPTYLSHGGSTDLWGESWTASDINASNFGVAISATEQGGVNSIFAGIDAIRITVYYTYDSSFSQGVASDGLYKFSQSSTLGTNNLMSLNSNGTVNFDANVGIGSSSPNQAFVVQGSSGAFFKVHDSFGHIIQHNDNSSDYWTMATRDSGDFSIATQSTDPGNGFIGSSNDVVTINNTGATTFKNNTNGTTAFRIQNSSSQDLFVVDTLFQRIAIGPGASPANGRLTIGTNTTTASGGLYFGTDVSLYRSGNDQLRVGVDNSTATLLVLDTKNTSTDPSCVNGGMYYNSASDQAKICINGGWAAVGVPEVSTLPSSPNDGDEVYYTQSAHNPDRITWHLRFDQAADDDDGYGWVVLGGGSLFEGLGGHSTSSSSYTAGGGPYVYPKVDGIWDITVGARMNHDDAAGHCRMTYSVNLSPATESRIHSSGDAAHGAYTTSTRTDRHELTGSPQTIAGRYSSANGTCSYNYRNLWATPIRLES